MNERGVKKKDLLGFGGGEGCMSEEGFAEVHIRET